MVPNLVRDDIRLRKIAWSTKPSLEFFVERQVDIHLLIERAIKWSRCSTGKTAGAFHLPGEKDERGFGVATAKCLGEKIAPHIFVVGNNHANKLRHRIVARLCRCLLRLVGRPGELWRNLCDLLWIDSQKHERHNQENR